jgi:alkylation response protein AidB-like acyl-CoA dehydrogenase
MISFTPTDDQHLLIDTIRRYALNDVRPAAHDADEDGALPAALVQKGWELGLVPSVIPEELGGFGDPLSAITGALAAEELAYGDLALALAVLSPALFAYPLVLYGTAEQRENLLPLFLDEKQAPATAALLEPGISFDPNALKTTATVSGDKARLNGVKAYVPQAEDARWLLVYARNSETGAAEAYLVEGGVNGVRIDRREKLMGVRALPAYRVAFEDAEVDLACRLGGSVGIDYPALLNRQRVALAALAVGVARAAFEYARDYAKERVQFGKPIAQNQAIAFMLAECAVEIDAARLIAWEAAWKLDQGQDATREAYLAKLYADKAVLFVTDSGVQTLGGYGFIREYPAERWLRNGRGFPMFDGLAMV